MARINREDQSDPREPGIGGLVNRLNKALFPWLGPPPLGPYDDPPAPAEAPRCPLCHSPMAEHVIDRSGPRTMLTCPA